VCELLYPIFILIISIYDYGSHAKNTFNYNLSLQCIVPKAVYTVKKSAPEDGRICRPKHVGLL